MKKTFLILAALLCGCFALKAQDFTYEGLNYSVTGTNPPTVALTGHTEGFTAHDFVIPSTVEDNDGTTYSVTSIGDYAFNGCSGLTGSLTIPNSVTSIGWDAFNGCLGLTGSLTIGSSVTSIGDFAFAYCSGFTGSLTIPNSVTSIGYYAFADCSNFTGSLTIGSSVTSIEACAFFECSGFTGSLTIPNLVTSIGESAFFGCSGFKGSLTIGSSVTSLGVAAFAYTQFAHIIAKPVIPPSLVDDTFSGITVQSIIVPCDYGDTYKENEYWNPWADIIVEGFLDHDLTVASANPEFGSASITQSATCENHQATVTATPAANCMFRNWTENGVVVSTANPYTFTLESDCNLVANFTECTYVYGPIMSLPSPIDPDAVYHLGYQVGNDYYLHTSGTAAGQMLLSKNPENPVEYKIKSMQYGTGTIIYAFADNYGSSGNNYLHIDMQGVSYGTFNPMNSPTDPFSLSIVEGNISSAAASGYTVCHNENDIITVHTTDTSEGNLRFFSANGTIKPLYHITISATPEGAGMATATMGGVPVQSAAEGTEITVTAEPVDGYKFVNWTENGAEVSTTNPYTFTLESDRNLVANFFRQYDFSAICETGQTLYYRIIDAEQHWVKIVAPNGDNWSSWDDYTKPAGDITLPETVEYDGTNYTVTAIGDCSLFGCDGLTGSLTIPNSVTSIGIYAISGCSGFTGSLTIGSSVTSIEECAFQWCSGLTGSLTIPNSVTSIGDDAFQGCSGFTGSLTIGSSVTSIGNGAFIWCYGFTGSLTIGSSVENIGWLVFDGCSFDNIISKASNAPSLADYIPCVSNKVYIPTGALQSYQSNWGSFEYNFIEYDREDYHFNGTGNEWNTAANWEENEVPTRSCPTVFINADCQVNTNAEVGTVIVAAGKTLTVNEGYIFKADGFTLENGAQLVNNGTVNSSSLTVKKDIAGYGTDTGGWHLVSSPVGKIGIPSGMRTNSEENYDLYRFEQTGDGDGNEWINAKFVESHGSDFFLDNQSGYLYASKNGTTIVFRGNFASTETKTLAYDANADFPGFNLVGNPYPCNATISGTGLRSSNYFYKMNVDGTNLEVVVNPILAPCTGVFAVAANSNATVTFAKTNATANVTRGKKSSLQDIRVELLANGKTIDRAFLNMNGESLPKFRLQDNNSEIYFYQNKEELAVVSTDATRGEMPLNFKAAKNGSYTISVNVGDVDLNYLHLVDNLTGNDVDLLGDGTGKDAPWRVSTYTFDAKTSDYASRFKLVFGVKDTEPAEATDTFAFISNGEIVISNEGRATLQVIDVLGRIVSSEEINGECRISTQGLTAGMYVLSLNGNVQKIVVR